jgi:cytochrome c biogenesis protein CcdA
MFSCMPFLSPLLVGHSGDSRAALRVILPFSAGRIFSYTMLAMVAYAGSALVKAMLNDNSRYVMILGSGTILMGLYMFYKTFQPVTSCAQGKPLVKKPTFNRMGFFAIGASMSVNPCAPIMTLAAVAANATGYLHAAALGIAFGIGAVAFSILFYGWIVSTLIRGLMQQFSRYKKAIERVAALLLVIVGALVLSGRLIL